MGALAFFGTLAGKLLLGALGLLLTVGLLGGGLYLNDYGLEATVIDKDCSGSPKTVTVETRVGGIEHAQEVDTLACSVVQRGNFVIYNVQSGRTRLYESEGGCLIYDSATGISSACGGGGGGGNSGGGGLGGLGGFAGTWNDDARVAPVQQD